MNPGVALFLVCVSCRKDGNKLVLAMSRGKYRRGRKIIKNIWGKRNQLDGELMSELHGAGGCFLFPLESRASLL